jgi:hypothetical protein
MAWKRKSKKTAPEPDPRVLVVPEEYDELPDGALLDLIALGSHVMVGLFEAPAEVVLVDLHGDRGFVVRPVAETWESRRIRP